MRLITNKSLSKLLLCTLVFILFQITSARGQDASVDTLTWQSSHAIVKNDTSEIDYNNAFTTTNATVEWSQKDGVRNYKYTVTGTEGSWTDITTDGQMKFNIASNRTLGYIIFSRQAGQLTAHLVTSGSKGQSMLDVTFDISTVQRAQ